MSNQESKFDFLATRKCLVKIERGTRKNKNRPHQPTIKFPRFLPINFLPLPAPPRNILLGKKEEKIIFRSNI